MKRKEKNNILKGSLFVTAIVSGFIITMMLLANVNEPIIKQIEQEDREWITVAGDSPQSFATAGNTGIVGIYIYPHQANPTTAYATNLSTATAYAFEGTHYNTSLGGNVPASTAFDIVIKVRVVKEDIVNGTTHQLSWARMNLTCPHTTPVISTLTSMTQQNITNQVLGDPIDSYQHYYLNNGGSGYTIGNGVNANVTAFKLEIYS